MKNFNVFKVYLRGFSLLISLSLVLSVIAYLRGGRARHFIDQQMSDFLGVQPVHRQTIHPANSKSVSLRLCKTRVEAVQWSNGARIFEDSSQSKPRWMSIEPKGIPRELNTLNVEKWFGINCVLRVLPIEKDLGDGLNNFLNLTFVGGDTEQIKKNTSGEFRFGQLGFHSQELIHSLSELYQLGEFNLPEPK